MKKRMNRAAAMLLTVVLAVSLAPTALAAKMTAVSPTDKGAITLTFRRNGTPKSGLEVTLYRVGEAEIVDNNLVFKELLSGAKNELKQDETSVKAATEDLAKAINALSDADKAALAPAAPQKSGEDGKVEFKDVQVGVYLAMQTSASGSYKFSPVLLFVPANGQYKLDEATGKYEWTATNEWNDEVDGYVKVEYTGGGGGGGDKTEEIPETPPPTTPVTPPSEPPLEDIPDEAPPTALPQTGLLQWPVPVMAMAGLLLVALGAASERKRKNAR